MSKAVLVINMPYNCEECELVETVNGKLSCSVPRYQKYVEDYIGNKPDWCPLVPMMEQNTEQEPDWRSHIQNRFESVR